jgi:hypothetical protein
MLLHVGLKMRISLQTSIEVNRGFPIKYIALHSLKMDYF